MARSRTSPGPRKDKPQAIPAKAGTVQARPTTPPPRGKIWVKAVQKDGTVVWVLKDRPKGTSGSNPSPDQTGPNPPKPVNDGSPRDGSGSGGAGDGGSGDPPADAPPEEDDRETETFDRSYWAQFFPGLPDDVLDDLQSFWNNTPNATDAELVGHLKQTDWYRREYGAFETGVLNGVFSAGGYDAYRNWKSSIKDAMGRYGIDEATASTVMDTAAKNGWGADRVEREFAADAYVKANQGDLQYVSGAFDNGQYTQEELKALGQQQVGVGNDLGAQLQTRVQQAFQKMNRLFEGTLAVSDLGQTAQQDRRRRADLGA